MFVCSFIRKVGLFGIFVDGEIHVVGKLLVCINLKDKHRVLLTVSLLLVSFTLIEVVHRSMLNLLWCLKESLGFSKLWARRKLFCSSSQPLTAPKSEIRNEDRRTDGCQVCDKRTKSDLSTKHSEDSENIKIHVPE